MRIEKVAILNEVTARIKESDYCFIAAQGASSALTRARATRASWW